MKNQDYYEINISGLLALCLIKWKTIVGAALLTAAVFGAGESLFFRRESPAGNPYIEIEAAIDRRSALTGELEMAQKKFDENLYYKMKAENLVSKRLVVSVQRENRQLTTDRYDPVDTVVYAYHNAARSDLRGGVLPEILTKQQEEQLFGFDYDTEKNLITIHFTCEDEALCDKVLHRAKEWMENQQNIVSDGTYRHRLAFLPVSATVYSRDRREKAVSPAPALAQIGQLKSEIARLNDELDILFSHSGSWAAGQTARELERELEKVRTEDNSPSAVKSAVIGLFLGLLAGLCLVCVPPLVKNRLLGDMAVENCTGWKFLGRTKEITPSGDRIVYMGQKILYKNTGVHAGKLGEDVSAMARLLIENTGMAENCSVALIGSRSREKLNRTARLFAAKGCNVQTANIFTQAILANEICRQADIIIFAGHTEDTSHADVSKAHRTAGWWGKEIKGYILV